ncbi:MAG: hypothetical protein LBR41_01520 [Rickettsiales bacterium]|nr:hypothetical protein [Rickettsiales bacterium]
MATLEKKAKVFDKGINRSQEMRVLAIQGKRQGTVADGLKDFGIGA